MGHGASKLAQDTQTLSSSPLVSPSSIASMAPCASSYASEGSGPSGTPGCRSHTHNDPIPATFSARGTPLLHPDLVFLRAFSSFYWWQCHFQCREKAQKWELTMEISYWLTWYSMMASALMMWYMMIIRPKKRNK